MTRKENQTMTFEQRVLRKRIATMIWLAVGAAALTAMVAVTMSFVVFVFIQPTPEARRLLLTVVAILAGGAYGAGWIVRGNLKESIDVEARNAGPLEREMIKARIEQENL